ncbi:MAG: hypothetical protein IPG07_06150 [Crocinitomicaceae bacterium]|nr:hypothetical protein [Crocinitomicaceae bacterium]
MSWINSEEYPPNKVYRTSSTEVNEVTVDLAVVIEQMIKMKISDNAENATDIMLYGNATNGYIGIYFYDMEELVEVGSASYMLELPDLFEKSLSHEDGADFFDAMVLKSAQAFASSAIGTNIKESYNIFYSNELGDQEHL